MGLGNSTKAKKSPLNRPSSESDFGDIAEFQKEIQPQMDDRDVEERFLKMLDDMNLTNEKRKPLLEQSIDKKRQLLCMREKGYNTVS